MCIGSRLWLRIDMRGRDADDGGDGARGPWQGTPDPGRRTWFSWNCPNVGIAWENEWIPRMKAAETDGVCLIDMPRRPGGVRVTDVGRGNAG